MFYFFTEVPILKVVDDAHVIMFLSCFDVGLDHQEKTIVNEVVLTKEDRIIFEILKQAALAILVESYQFCSDVSAYLNKVEVFKYSFEVESLVINFGFRNSLICTSF